MSRPKVFVGSSKKNIKVAQLLSQGLKEDAEVIIWNEGFFRLNQVYLESLFKALKEVDFAVFIFAPDDIIGSKDELKPTTRDNVLFEYGLFMGRLGIERVFIVYDESADLKMPTDFAGVTFAPYDGRLIDGSFPLAAVTEACRLIREAIIRPMFIDFVGEWRSKYRLTGEINHPLVEEDVDIKPSKGGISIINKNNSLNDYYKAQGNLVEERLLAGKWKAIQGNGSTRGGFLLTINPRGNIMYGYTTGFDDKGGMIYATWILAKKDGVDENGINERLSRGEEILKDTLST